MQTECNAEPMLFARFDRRELVADFGGGAISSDAGALLLARPTGRSGWWSASPRASPTAAIPVG